MGPTAQPGAGTRLPERLRLTPIGSARRRQLPPPPADFAPPPRLYRSTRADRSPPGDCEFLAPRALPSRPPLPWETARIFSLERLRRHERQTICHPLLPIVFGMRRAGPAPKQSVGFREDS